MSKIELSDGRYISYQYSNSDAATTVIFESGIGCPKEYWDGTCELIRNQYSYLTYDRAGVGESTPAAGELSVASYLSDLEFLLTELKITHPIVFVGHSFGCVLGRFYAEKHGQRRLAIVDVDRSDQDFREYVLSYRNEKQKQFWIDNVYSLNPPKELIGLNRELAAFDKLLSESKSCSLDHSIPVATLVCDNLRGLGLEQPVHFPKELVPLQVLERDNFEWIEFHKRTASKYANSEFAIAKNSTHLIPIDNPRSIVSLIDWALRRSLETWLDL